MADFFMVSDAGSLALHAVIMIAARSDRPVKIRDIASVFTFSEAHLAKVLSRLVRAGIVTATRGPSGGYRLAKRADDITLHDIYRAVEGEMSQNRCMFRISVCDGSGCPLGTFFNRLSREVEEKLKQTHLSDISYYRELLRKVEKYDWHEPGQRESVSGNRKV
ncbi:RrF2 family transcriptional regulator [Candidatus Latescibacterota bacterium]